MRRGLKGLGKLRSDGIRSGVAMVRFGTGLRAGMVRVRFGLIGSGLAR